MKNKEERFKGIFYNLNFYNRLIGALIGMSFILIITVIGKILNEEIIIKNTMIASVGFLFLAFNIALIYKDNEYKFLDILKQLKGGEK